MANNDHNGDYHGHSNNPKSKVSKAACKKHRLKKQRSAAGASLTCDQAFAEYLVYLAARVSESFYIRALKFVVLYRDCVIQMTLENSSKPTLKS